MNIFCYPILYKILVFITALMCFTSTQIFATTGEQKGFDIAARRDRSDRGFFDSQVKLKMILRNAAGSESSRSLSLKTLENVDEDIGDKNVIVFDRPADISGTALLSFSKILIEDDQWIYFPVLKRIKRISSVNKSGPFVGSEFAFEDLTTSELNKYNYKYLNSELCGDLQCDRVERYPRYEYSGYTKQIVWIDQQTSQIRKIEYYERRGELLKTLKIKNYKQYHNSFWRAHFFVMTNHQNGKITKLEYSEYNFKTGLKDKDFRKNIFSRGR